MKIYIYPLFIFVGFIMGCTFPFYALTLSRWAFVFLFILLTINIFPINLNFKSIITHNSTDRYFIFFSYFFMPALVFVLTHLLHINQSLALGYFMTSLAPLAIITPQFLNTNENKVIALKHILISTFLFPLYFALMLFLFFPKLVKLNILSIVQDSFILTAIPIIIVAIFIYYFKDLKIKIQNAIQPILPILNMAILGILCFIFVGSSYLKNDLRSFETIDWIWIAIMAIFQDFGVYYLARLFKFPSVHQVAIAMKNVAFVGTFALIFFPKALLPTIAVMVTHTFLIIFFNSLKKRHPAN